MASHENSHTILVTGANGQVGFELCKILAPLGKVVPVDVQDCDLTSREAIEHMMRSVRPSIVVNPAAYTAVDKAQEEQQLARSLNSDAPAILAREAKKLRALFVHYSTDYVFDGTKGEPWVESDPTAPLSVYGQTKRDGENAVMEEQGASLIFRLEWVYGVRGTNFFLRILQLAHEREELKIVNDQFGAPTWSSAIAEATAAVIAQGLQDPFEFGSQHAGIYHMAAGGRTTWFDFAKSFLAADPLRMSQTLKNLLPIPSSAYPTPAQRPTNSVLSCDKLQRTFGIKLASWESLLNRAMSEYAGAVGQDAF
jgi:dTDP-4-dehydrorhamnose reductase